MGLPCRLLLEALLSHRGIALQLHALLHAGGLELVLLQLSLMPELRFEELGFTLELRHLLGRQSLRFGRAALNSLLMMFPLSSPFMLGLI